jgi:2-dehydropantoate 2-reductase
MTLSPGSAPGKTPLIVSTGIDIADIVRYQSYLMDPKVWRIAVMGAGAVGGYFGARLAEAGHDVFFIARGKHLKALGADGLRVQSIQGDLHIRSLFTSDPRQIGPVDLILFCVKSYDTDEAGKKLAPLVKNKTLILSLQNGTDNADKIAELWGNERTLAATAYIGVRTSRPGTVEHAAGGRIVVGQLDGRISQDTKAVCDAFIQAQIPCTISKEIRKVLWGKLVWNAPFCAIATIAGVTAKAIVESDPLRTLAIGCMEEVKTAAVSLGLDLGPSVVEEALQLSRSLGDFKPSMLQDREAGKPLEYEALNGCVVEVMSRAGKEAPINQTFYAILQSLDKKTSKSQDN